jgi:serine/threonine protein kinase
MEKGTTLYTADHQYSVGKCLGRGAQGSVYKAIRGDGLEVAIKLIRDVTSTSLGRQHREGWAFQQFPNHFVRLLDWNLTCARPFLVLEFCIHGSAREHITYLSLCHSVTVPLLAQAARALEALHSQGFLYRDFKPDNLLLTQYGLGPWMAKLGDAGLICLPQELSLAQMTRFAGRGTAEYMAPESRFPGALFTQQAEAFAFGVTAVELLTGVRPSAGMRISSGPSELHSLFTGMIANDPGLRPSLREARLGLEAAGENLRQRNRAIGGVVLVVVGLIVASAFGKNRQ